MSKSYSLKSFIISRIFGLISFTVAIFLFLSLISFNENDITFGNITSSLKVLNYLGVYGAHISGFLLVSLHYSSYLIPVFFLMIGAKSTFGIKYNNFFIHVVSLLIGICILNLSLSLGNINAGLIGKFFFDITKNFLINFQHNVFLKWAMPGFFFFIVRIIYFLWFNS